MNKLFLAGVISTLTISACGGGSALPHTSPASPQSSVLSPQTAPASPETSPVSPETSPTSPETPPASPQVTLPQASLPTAVIAPKTENCITSSYGWTSDYASPGNNFILPSQADLGVFRQTGFTCARVPIGSGSSQDAMYISEANAYHAAGISVQGVISSADINNLPPASVFAVSDEIEAGNELDVDPNYNSAQFIAYTKAVASAARAVNPRIKIISAGVTKLDFLVQIIPSLTNVIDCVGVHPYGMIPANFGVIATNIRAQYGLNACFTEWGDTPGNRLTPLQIGQGYTSSQGKAAVFNFFNLGQLESNIIELNALSQ